MPLNTISTFLFVGSLSLVNLKIFEKSMRCIILDDFNPQRLYYFCEEYIKNNNMLTPIEINKKERMFFRKLNLISFSEHSLDYIIKNENDGDYIVELFEIFKDKRYFCYVKKYYSCSKLSYDYKIFVCLRVDADNHDLFLSYFLAIKLKIILKISNKLQDIIETIKQNLNDFHEKKTFFEELKLKGWSTNFSILEERYCRYHILYK